MNGHFWSPADIDLIADFMDGKHIAVVGGSWALHPRVAGRKSL